jgi:predicted nucleic acid-binding protein
MTKLDLTKIRGLYQKKATVDNNVLNDLAELGRIDLLEKVFEEIQIPSSILQDETLDFVKKQLLKIKYYETSISTEDGLTLLGELLTNWTGLSDYDAEIISIAKQNMVLCSSNEKRIMNACDFYGIEFCGTVGILCCAFEFEIVTSDDLYDLLEKLFSDECTCHLNHKLKIPIYKHYKLIT